MIESLVAILIGAIIAFGLFDMATGAMRAMTKASVDAQAYEIIEELTEHSRAYGYQNLLKFSGQTINVTLNNADAVQYDYPDFQHRPAFFDFSRRQWSSKTVSSKFEGALTYKVFAGPESGTLNVAIDLHWNDAFTGAPRSVGRVIVVINPEGA